MSEALRLPCVSSEGRDALRRGHSAAFLRLVRQRRLRGTCTHNARVGHGLKGGAPLRGLRGLGLGVSRLLRHAEEPLVVRQGRLGQVLVALLHSFRQARSVWLSLHIEVGNCALLRVLIDPRAILLLLAIKICLLGKVLMRV